MVNRFASLADEEEVRTPAPKVEAPAPAKPAQKDQRNTLNRRNQRYLGSPIPPLIVRNIETMVLEVMVLETTVLAVVVSLIATVVLAEGICVSSCSPIGLVARTPRMALVLTTGVTERILRRSCI